MTVEELSEEVILVKIDVDEFDVLVLRNTLAAEQTLKCLDLVLGILIRIGVEESNDGLFLRGVGIGCYLSVRELVQEVAVRRYHGDLIEEHSGLLEKRDVPIRGTQQGNTAVLQPTRDLLSLLQRALVELGLQEVDRVLEFGMVRRRCDLELVEEV